MEKEIAFLIPEGVKLNDIAVTYEVTVLQKIEFEGAGNFNHISVYKQIFNKLDIPALAQFLNKREWEVSN